MVSIIVSLIIGLVAIESARCCTVSLTKDVDDDD